MPDLHADEMRVVIVDLWSGFGDALCALLVLSDWCRVNDEHSDVVTEALLVAFPAVARVWRVEDIQARCFNRVAQTLTLRDLGK